MWSMNCANLYMPIYRLAFSVYANSLASQQIKKLIQAKNNVEVDSCTFRSPNIIFIIGESYNRHHAQIYGYDKPTTPEQDRLERSGMLNKFTDVIAPWNLTSYVFKNVFRSMWWARKASGATIRFSRKCSARLAIT